MMEDNQNLSEKLKYEIVDPFKNENQFIINSKFILKDKSHALIGLEYCPGGELNTFLKVKGRFSLEETKFYASNVALGLEKLHELNILYRE